MTKYHIYKCVFFDKDSGIINLLGSKFYIKIFNQYLFLLIHSKFYKNYLIKSIKDFLFKFRLPRVILKQNPIYFDSDWYRNRYDFSNEINPIVHYLKIGFKKGYNPSPNFDTNFYLNEYPDVKKENVNPFIHYLRHGIYEGRLPKLFTLTELKEQKFKLCLKGRSKYLFLFNDGNNEILQHYDKKYESNFDKVSFLEHYYYKKSLFNEMGIDYAYYDVPDKSVVCKKFLPFQTDFMQRNVEDVDEINDFVSVLTPEDYFKNDSHMNFDGGEKLAFKILNHIDDSFDSKTYDNLISNYSTEVNEPHKHDLVAYQNWSYSLFEKFSFLRNDVKMHCCPTSLQFLHDDIPKGFEKCRERKSDYFKNEKSFSNLRVLIFHDSSIEYLKWYFTFYFREIFLFWDHGYLNKDLINWYNPDLILEIRIERFIENLANPSWVLNKEGIKFV